MLPDALAVVVGYLADHPAVRAVLPASPADGKAHVAPAVGPPWPVLRVQSTPAGSDRNLRHLTDQELLVEVWGAPLDVQASSPAALRHVLYVALAALAELPHRTHTAGQPVVTAVRSTVGGSYVPDPTTGQPRVLAAVMVTLHAAAAV
jgi:hypothetical protein